jgi:hypothetical protein
MDLSTSDDDEWQKFKEKKRNCLDARIVCAANRLPCGHILVGARHWDMMMHSQMDYYLEATLQDFNKPINEETGFIDQWGNFYDRKEAYIIAKRQGQIINSIGYETDQLYSEHLY